MKNLSSQFNFRNHQITWKDDRNYLADTSGKSKFSTVTVDYGVTLKGGTISITCYDWSDKLAKQNGWQDSLVISIQKMMLQ